MPPRGRRSRRRRHRPLDRLTDRRHEVAARRKRPPLSDPAADIAPLIWTYEAQCDAQADLFLDAYNRATASHQSVQIATPFRVYEGYTDRIIGQRPGVDPAVLFYGKVLPLLPSTTSRERASTTQND
ncbi:MAG: uncharacterized protein KVP18_001133 [Porospora cf. gigantea A]|uniref:uncharacterized protein n=1 Tax=Porospora cf. gigantea A TaxID=2853593 RepID=UPI0035594C80|nr:MAG: hypothetical protein KVP18_001133 [Porospora cf. gigantea A]